MANLIYQDDFIKPVRTLTEEHSVVEAYDDGTFKRYTISTIFPDASELVDGIPLLNVYGQYIYNLINNKNSSLFFDVSKLTEENLQLFEGSIYYKPLQIIYKINYYKDLGYNSEEIQQVLYYEGYTDITQETIKNSKNINFLFVFCFAYPFYEYCNGSNDYKTILNNIFNNFEE